jgi:hypothetical protein
MMSPSATSTTFLTLIPDGTAEKSGGEGGFNQLPGPGDL